jgi:hypothetical protein
LVKSRVMSDVSRRRFSLLSLMRDRSILHPLKYGGATWEGGHLAL